MITCQFPVATVNGKEGYFDFGAVNLPIGLTNQELLFFNKEDIQQVLFVGYIDVSFQEFISKYDQLIESIPYEKLTSDVEIKKGK